MKDPWNSSIVLGKVYGVAKFVPPYSPIYLPEKKFFAEQIA